jgi:hypothetical protein
MPLQITGLLKDENTIQKVPRSSNILAGVSNFDDGSTPELGFTMPALVNPAVSWLDYRCWIECYLDSGIAIHTPLPQSVDGIDTLGSNDIYDPSIETSKAGVNLKSMGKFNHIQQRMAASKYRFCLKGYARRFAFQIPIPKLVTIGGVPAVPDDERPQKAYNVLIANMNGVPLFQAEWELWYTILIPPTTPQLPPINLAQHIRADVTLPPNGEVQVPISQPDSNAVQTPLPVLQTLQGQ